MRHKRSLSNPGSPNHALRARRGSLAVRILVWLVICIATAIGAVFYLRLTRVNEDAPAVSRAQPRATPPPRAEGVGKLLLMMMGVREPGNVKGAPIPAGKDVRLERTVNREFTQWRIKKTLESYEKAGAGKTTTSQEIRKFLTDVCNMRQWMPDAPTGEELAKRGQALIDGGCAEPQVLEAYAAALGDAGQEEKAIEVLDQAIDGMVEAKYPRLQVGLACAMRFRLEAALGGERSLKAIDLKKAALAALIQAVQNGEVPGVEMHHVERVFRQLVEYNGRNEWIQAWQLIGTTPGLDPWLRKLVQGEAKIKQAWAARGGGWASEVSPDGWKGFKEYLEQARALLTEAWKLRPDRPQAAAAMIAVVMGGCGAPGETERTWFDRAVATQLDYSPAYENLAWALRPRWGGSHAALMSLAKECLDTGRFDTGVPWRYLILLREVAGEYALDSWRAAFREPGVHENLVKLFEGYLKHAQAEKDRELETHIRRQWAVTESWCGNYEKAGEMIAALPAEDKLISRYLNWAVTWGGMDRKGVEAEIRACTGPDKEVLAKAEEHLANDRIKECLNLLTTALETGKADREVYNYIRDRMAFILMSDAENLVGSPSFRGWALQQAVSLDHEPALEFLLARGADLNTVGADDLTALQFALLHKRGKMAQKLLEHGANPNLAEEGSITPLILAIQMHDAEMAMLLVQKGADVNKIAEGRWAPLCEGLREGMNDLVRVMLDKGANVNLQVREDWTPLLLAISWGKLDAVGMLLERGAKPNLGLKDGWTGLIGAVTKDNAAMARLLLEKGADPNAVYQGSGYTALHIAANHGNVEIAKLLLEKGARRDAKLTKDGRTPLDVAREQKKQAVVELLEAP